MVRAGIYVRNKDEVNIIEFMEHYYSLGFEFILMLDDYSKIHPSSVIGNKFHGKYKVIQIDKSIIARYTNRTDYLNKGEVFGTYILPEIKKYMDYCLYVDMDEYLVIKKYENINAVIDFYQPFEQLKINWIFFGNNDIKICENLSKLKPLFTKSALKCNIMVKSLVNVNSIIGNNDPHVFNINGITKNILNEITHAHSFDKNLTDYTFKDLHIYMAHYITQDTMSLVKRRFCRSTQNIDELVNELNYIDNKNIIKTDLLNYLNNNIINVIDYVHGVHDNVDIFLRIYKDTLIYIKKNYFKGHNCNETNNVDLIQSYIHAFDWKLYLDKYPDLRANGIHSNEQALQHWNNHGKKEGRQASVFDWKLYLDKYPDLRANGIHSNEQALQHWNYNGKHEGRTYTT